MSMQERTGERDLTLNRWRRPPRMPETFVVIDVDQLGYCGDCGEPLFLVEAVRGGSPKSTFAITRLSQSMQYPVPVLLARYRVDQATGQLEWLRASFRLPRDDGRVLADAEWIEWEHGIRAEHRAHCPKARA